MLAVIMAAAVYIWSPSLVARLSSCVMGWISSGVRHIKLLGTSPFGG